MIMKKAAFTLGLAFFAIGLFAQSSTATSAKVSPTTSISAKKEPAKAAPMQHTQPAPAAKPAMASTAAKPNSTPAARPNKSAATSTPAANKTASDPTKKKHHARRHKTATTPATGTPKSAPAAKKNK